jgi:UPF0271 protein
MNVEPLGDGALRWALPPNTDHRALLDALRALPNVIDAVVTERHACVTFDPERPPERPWEAAPATARTSGPRSFTVRVRYDGPDLADVAKRCSVSPEEVARLHAGREYVVATIGFLPGFAYLRELDPKLFVPRRSSPRPRMVAGSVAIAAGYTGIYPLASPGGWHVIGTATDFAPFSAERGAALALGDRVRFVEAQDGS